MPWIRQADFDDGRVTFDFFISSQDLVTQARFENFSPRPWKIEVVSPRGRAFEWTAPPLGGSRTQSLPGSQRFRYTGDPTPDPTDDPADTDAEWQYSIGPG